MVDEAAEARGRWYRHRREAVGLIQAEVASIAGLGVKTVGNLERGVHVSEHTVALIRQALHIPDDEWPPVEDTDGEFERRQPVAFSDFSRETRAALLWVGLWLEHQAAEVRARRISQLLRMTQDNGD